ncbi:D-aminoacylase, partial [bacterium]|nr:D-aminoacylase [bacterium]
LEDRGILIPGAYADIVVFDLKKIRMKGDYLKPAQRPDGIEYVIINGKVVYKNNAHTGVRSGKILRHEYE